MPPRILPHLFMLFIAVLMAAAEDFSCSASTSISGKEYDLSALNLVKEFKRERSSPPTMMIDTISMNICADLEPGDGPAQDQCPTGTRACLIKTNIKDEQERIIAVIPLATTTSLDPQKEALTGSDRQGIKLTLHGGAYPENGATQSLSLELICSSEETEPKLVSYENNVASVEWSTPSACAKTEGETPPAETPIDDNVPSGSGLGWFFLLFFLAFGAYFAIGAYHNYTNYGASGWDLIPHRDFWRDVPFLLRDLAHHLLSVVRGTPSRGGYHAV